MCDILEWEERVLASKASGRDPKLPNEDHLSRNRRQIGQDHIVLHRG